MDAHGISVGRHSGRRHERAAFDGTMALCRGRRVELVKAVDIGEGGAFLRTGAALAERSLLTLHIRVPGIAQGFTVMGRVVRARQEAAGQPDGVGVEFLDIMPAQRAQVAGYVERARTTPPQRRAG